MATPWLGENKNCNQFEIKAFDKSNFYMLRLLVMISHCEDVIFPSVFTSDYILAKVQSCFQNSNYYFLIYFKVLSKQWRTCDRLDGKTCISNGLCTKPSYQLHITY